MNTYLVKTDQNVFRTSNTEVYVIQANDINEAQNLLKSKHNRNPFYFSFADIEITKA